MHSGGRNGESMPDCLRKRCERERSQCPVIRGYLDETVCGAVMSGVENGFERGVFNAFLPACLEFQPTVRM